MMENLVAGNLSRYIEELSMYYAFSLVYFRDLQSINIELEGDRLLLQRYNKERDALYEKLQVEKKKCAAVYVDWLKEQPDVDGAFQRLVESVIFDGDIIKLDVVLDVPFVVPIDNDDINASVMLFVAKQLATVADSLLERVLLRLLEGMLDITSSSLPIYNQLASEIIDLPKKAEWYNDTFLIWQKLFLRMPYDKEAFFSLKKWLRISDGLVKELVIEDLVNNYVVMGLSDEHFEWIERGE